MSKKHNPPQKSNHHTVSDSSSDCKKQQPKLTEEEITGIREKLRPHRHTPYVERLYAALMPN